MPNDLERRIEKLESALSTRERFIVFDHMKGDIETQRAAYMASTPETERAQLFISLIDPTQRNE